MSALKTAPTRAMTGSLKFRFPGCPIMADCNSIAARGDQNHHANGDEKLGSSLKKLSSGISSDGNSKPPPEPGVPLAPVRGAPGAVGPAIRTPEFQSGGFTPCNHLTKKSLRLRVPS